MGATLPTLTAAATVTSRIRLGTVVASPNFRHPVPFAKELATLDDIAGRRFIPGPGPGGTGFDATVLGSPELTARERHERFAEFLEQLVGRGRHLGFTDVVAHWPRRDGTYVGSVAVLEEIAMRFPRLGTV